MGARWWTVGVVLLALASAACHRQARPTYEYEPTETYTSTTGDPTPQRVQPAERHPEPAEASVSPQPVESIEPAPAVESTQEPEPGEAVGTPAEGARRWYKAKPW